jgi:hypothetical protein
MSFAYVLSTLCAGALLTSCTGVVPTFGEQSDVHQLYTTDPVPVAFEKTLQAVAQTGGTIVRSDPATGTIAATAYRGKVTVLMLIRPSGSQTRVEALARTEPGTFSHGRLDLAERILAHYEGGR